MTKSFLDVFLKPRESLYKATQKLSDPLFIDKAVQGGMNIAANVFPGIPAITEGFKQGGVGGAVSNWNAEFDRRNPNPMESAVKMGEGFLNPTGFAGGMKNVGTNIGKNLMSKVLYHGTSSKEVINKFINKKGPVYLTDSKKAAKIYEGIRDSLNSRSKGGIPRTLEIQPKPGKIVKMASKMNRILEAIDTGDSDLLPPGITFDGKYGNMSFDDLVKSEMRKAKKLGARYFEFLHPEGYGTNPYKTIISLYPENDLIIKNQKLPILNKKQQLFIDE